MVYFNRRESSRDENLWFCLGEVRKKFRPSAPYLESVTFRLLTSETLTPEQNKTRVNVGKNLIAPKTFELIEFRLRQIHENSRGVSQFHSAGPPKTREDLYLKQ